MLFCRISKRKRIAIMIPVLAATIVAVIMKETPLERTHRICQDCGLSDDEIETLIQQVSESGLTPVESVESWKQTADPENVELCRDCVDAVIEAAG